MQIHNILELGIAFDIINPLHGQFPGVVLLDGFCDILYSSVDQSTPEPRREEKKGEIRLREKTNAKDYIRSNELKEKHTHTQMIYKIILES